MKLEIGKSYMSKQGHVVNIILEDIPKDGRRVFIDTVGRSYFEDGEYYYSNNIYSLVSDAN